VSGGGRGCRSRRATVLVLLARLIARGVLIADERAEGVCDG